MANKFYNTDFQRFLYANSISNTDIAKFLGVSNSMITQLVQGKTKLSPEKLKQIIDNSNWDTSMLQGQSASFSIGDHNIIASATAPNATATNTVTMPGQTKGEVAVNKGEIAVLPQEVAKAVDTDIMELINAGKLEMREPLPTLPPYNICYRNPSDCMTPYILPGDQLALQLVNKGTPIFGGQIYAIDYKRTGLIISRVYEEEEELKLVYFNPVYPPVRIKKCDVYNFFRIVARLSSFISGAGV